MVKAITKVESYLINKEEIHLVYRAINYYIDNNGRTDFEMIKIRNSIEKLDY